MAEDSFINALSGFAMGNLLSEMDVNADLEGAGLGGRIDGVGQEDIYNDNWEEDEDGRDDLEMEIDEEFKNEKRQSQEKSQADKYYLAGLAALGGGPPQQQPDFPSQAVVQQPPIVVEKRTIQSVFPNFEQGKLLDFADMFNGSQAGGGMRKKRKRIAWYLPDAHISPPMTAQQSQPPNALASLLPSPPATPPQALDPPSPPKTAPLSMVDLDEWESAIAFDASLPLTQLKPASRKGGMNLDSAQWTVEYIDWEDDVVWDASYAEDVVEKRRKMVLEERQEEEDDGKDVVKPLLPPLSRRTDAAEEDPFNISNDQFYITNQKKIRQTFGSIIVKHAYPAVKLQVPFYKTHLTKSHTRSWHRTPLTFPTNIKLSFSAVKKAPTLKDRVGRKLSKGGDIVEGLRKSSDLTIRDTSNFILYEFSEEHPPVMSGYGMGSVLVNYYRKTSDTDDYIPRLELGEPFVLDPTDEPPYSTFCPIDAGKTQPTLYNNLFKAPVWRHQAAPTDYLVVRAWVKGGEQKYFIREIKSLYAVGQIIPTMAVPGPHARQVSQIQKARTHQIAFKLLEKAKGNKMKLSRLMRYFPDTHELQMRQKLKDFLEFHRKGPHQQTWRLKEGLPFPEPSEWVKMVDPESMMLLESMQVGSQVLLDAGYAATDKEDKQEDESKMDAEQLLAPWRLTKSYMLSQRDKSWVKLYGEGDPTGRGEGFSFIKASMKDLFLRDGETLEMRKAYVATLPKAQQKQGHNVQEAIFRQEARRIYDAQAASLSNPNPPEYSDDEDEVQPQQQRSRGRSFSRGASMVLDDISSPAFSPHPNSIAKGRTGSPGGISRASSIDRDDTMSVGSGRGYQNSTAGAMNAAPSKVLKIKRLVNGVWKTELVRDTNIINAYIRKRQIIEEKETEAEALMPSGDAERDKRMKKLLADEIEKLKKNQNRRLARKKGNIGEDGQVKPITSRKCANCGAVGHMKTNRKCPRWAEFNLKNAAPVSAVSASGLASAVGDFFVGSEAPSPVHSSAPAEGGGEPSVSFNV